MNRREFLFSVAATLIPRIIRVNSPINIPIWNPHPAQIKFLQTGHNIFYGGLAGGGKSLRLHEDLILLITPKESSQMGPK